VTGVDKCSNWCLASYSGIRGDAGMTLRFTPTELTTSTAIRPYSCWRSGPIAARTRLSFAVGGAKNHSVFVRGYRMLWCESLLKISSLRSVRMTDILQSNTGDNTKGGGRVISQARGGVISWFSSRNKGGGQPQLDEPGQDGGGVILESLPGVSKVSSSPFYLFRLLTSNLVLPSI
jgi:hypothetical protein